MNQVNIIGNIGAGPEVRSFNSAKRYCGSHWQSMAAARMERQDPRLGYLAEPGMRLMSASASVLERAGSHDARRRSLAHWL
jgi:hypothetical protein